MNRSTLYAVAASLAVAFAVTQSGTVAANQSGKVTQAGRYALTSAGDSAVLLDTESGNSWYLQAPQRNTDKPLWIAIKRQQDGQQPANGQLAPANLNGQLLEAQLALEKLKDDFGPRHPQVIQKQREIDLIQKMLSGAR